MRVLHLPPWEPTPAEAHQLAYFRGKGWAVERVEVGPPPGPTAAFRDALFAAARAARSPRFRSVASKPFDLFFGNEVFAAPFAVALPRTVRKVVAASGIQAERFRPARPGRLHDAEEQWVFRHVEADLYRAFHAAALDREEDAARLRAAGYAGARHVPVPFAATPAAGLTRGGTEAHDLLAVGRDTPEEVAGLERFYRHVYLPYLRPYRIRLTVGGPVAGRFAVADGCVARLSSAAEFDAKVVVVPGSRGTGWVGHALAAGRVVVTTPGGAEGLDPECGAFVAADFTHDPAGSAATILALLRDEPRRVAIGQRAVDLIARTRTRAAYTAGMDAVLGVARQAA